MTLSALQDTSSPDPRLHGEVLAESASPADRSEGSAPGGRRRRLIAAAIVLALIVSCALALLMMSRGGPASTPLGASGEIPGGVARVDGAIPLTDDGWEAPTPSEDLQSPVAEGLHRVRIVLDLISLSEAGMRFDGADYAIDGIGVSAGEPLWVSLPATTVPQGERVGVELVFEVPDEAVALVLTGPGSSRLSLGVGHSTH